MKSFHFPALAALVAVLTFLPAHSFATGINPEAAADPAVLAQRQPAP